MDLQGAYFGIPRKATKLEKAETIVLCSFYIGDHASTSGLGGCYQTKSVQIGV